VSSKIWDVASLKICLVTAAKGFSRGYQVGEAVLTAERILEAAEDVLRRFGPEKATVVDVARALGVTHGSVYRHFASKADLRDAVVRRWLETMRPALEAVASEEGSAGVRLRRWLDLLVATKRKLAADDPELFATYIALTTQAREVVRVHVDALVGQAARLIADGIARGEFSAVDPVSAGRAVFQATSRFHNPAHAAEWSDPGIDDALDAVWRLLTCGLAARDRARGSRPRDTTRPSRIPKE
jgi:AcrR family transcriptional regulator